MVISTTRSSSPVLSTFCYTRLGCPGTGCLRRRSPGTPGSVRSASILRSTGWLPPSEPVSICIELEILVCQRFLRVEWVDFSRVKNGNADISVGVDFVIFRFTIGVEHFESHLGWVAGVIVREGQDSLVKALLERSTRRPLEANPPAEEIIVFETHRNIEIGILDV